MRTRVLLVDPVTVRVRSLLPGVSAHRVEASEMSPHRFVAPFSRAVCCRSLVSMTTVSPTVIVWERTRTSPVVTLVRLMLVAGPVTVHTGKASSSPSLSTVTAPRTWELPTVSGRIGKNVPATALRHSMVAVSPSQNGEGQANVRAPMNQRAPAASKDSSPSRPAV